jgi:glycosyltransferase involved in cell wall biosynthesis
MQILEAFAAEVPVIMPQIGAYSEIVEKSKAGLCYNPNDISNLTEILQKVLIDNKLYSDLKQNCHSAIMKTFSSEEQTSKISEIYNS